ncbi:MAG: efflux RND transporter periplasmic adaptor subunit [Acidobacteria bacterium]|nr:efflux RND transporter periplasmic adaptor subunit [Acidobacteriota bacterium]
MRVWDSGLEACRRGGRRLGFVVVGVSVLLACQEPPKAETVLRPVRFEQVSTSRAARLRTFAGVAKAGLETRLSFRVSGTVERVPVVVGERVRRGHVLARLDATDYELRVQEALAGLAQAEAAARNAEADYERVRGLYENNNASRRELDGARANNESSQAQVVAVEKRLEGARQQVSYCTLHAPVDGTVASVAVEVNENIQAGQKLFLLTAAGDIDVEVALPELLIADIELGQRSVVRFDALPGRSFEAGVTEAGVAMLGTATTFAVTVRLEEADPRIRSGMAAEADFRFPVAGGQGRMLVAPVAVGEDRAGRYVFVLDKGSGTVGRRAVTVGELTADGLEVLSGLAEGELIVTAGVRRLTDGERVLVQESE